LADGRGSAGIDSVIVLSILVPGLLAFVGSVAGDAVARLTAREQERWRRREETMRLMRWGAELATEPAIPRAELGVAALRALTESPLLDAEDAAFVFTVLATAHTHYSRRQGGAP
jgi:hypothetical protein